MDNRDKIKRMWEAGLGFMVDLAGWKDKYEQPTHDIALPQVSIVCMTVHSSSDLICQLGKTFKCSLVWRQRPLFWV